MPASLVRFHVLIAAALIKLRRSELMLWTTQKRILITQDALNIADRSMQTLYGDASAYVPRNLLERLLSHWLDAWSGVNRRRCSGKRVSLPWNRRDTVVYPASGCSF